MTDVPLQKKLPRLRYGSEIHRGTPSETGNFIIQIVVFYLSIPVSQPSSLPVKYINIPLINRLPLPDID